MVDKELIFYHNISVFPFSCKQNKHENFFFYFTIQTDKGIQKLLYASH